MKKIILVALCIINFGVITPYSFKESQININKAYGVGVISLQEKTTMEKKNYNIRYVIDGTTISIMVIFLLYSIFFFGTKESI